MVTSISKSLSLDKDKDGNNNTIQSLALSSVQSLALSLDNDNNNNIVQSQSRDLEAKKVCVKLSRCLNVLHFSMSVRIRYFYMTWVPWSTSNQLFFECHFSCGLF